MTEIDPRVDVVRQAYAGLEPDDVDAFLGRFAADAIVRYPAEGALPYGGTWIGTNAIAEFLDRHDAIEEIVEFRVESVEAGATGIYARGRFAGTSRRTGRQWETRWVHAFTVVGGKIDSWDAFFDTAAAVEAHHS